MTQNPPSHPPPSAENTPPSKVIHVHSERDINPQDIITFLHTFGEIAYVFNMKSPNQMLIEMADKSVAEYIVDHYKQNGPPIMGDTRVYFQYSSSQSINRNTSLDEDAQNVPPSKILLITVHNPIYPITVDVLGTILKDYNVLRIVFFQKNRVCALAEFESIEVATAAKEALDGQQIYEGCCEIRIMYSKNHQNHLNVEYNNEQTYDFTRPNLPTEPRRNPARRPLQPKPDRQPNFQSRQLRTQPWNQQQYMQPMYPMTPYYDQNQMMMMMMGGMGNMGPMNAPGRMGYNQPITQSNLFSKESSVLIVHNLPNDETRKIPSTQHIYNLFSLYGHCQKVKRFYGQNTALVEMETTIEANWAIAFLNGLKVLDSQLDVRHSVHHSIAWDTPTTSPPETDLFNRDFSLMPANRVVSIAQSQPKGYSFKPTQHVHMKPVLSSATEADVIAFFSEAGAPTPVSVDSYEFAPDTRGKKDMKRCIATFDSIDNAVSAVFLTSHRTMTNMPRPTILTFSTMNERNTSI
ncbi:putative Heterogeneous nuclear ribonucleoprotein L [Blattamonas nauphoetae]|uniref:Heterogeneous nuclear ribonucleoprotein L n=1 Tax=Blattamonas nauphoetae TaxID=2049346 RepID=A0ABQ9XFG8_9EUKA|nr:putative Heterogeneous nuclear ribonucleoprotein L [Blattamonas nauphoetae]